ncbi:peptidase A24A prepilin type IV [Desulfofarcimen acetoxidans DSM 771]|uniref:Peptidase A24A prepilin type IV n=1 Tax=Desulfofarcimen acetoxidans (strain ATCC 49208 / DSM 771 / KCTC 5769 / VKM B-1644 / 5575) TaxID=485916 RepID=C8VVN3_DESAS|nr:A24 family peptidase [Desulfofarcimen acetoxidans]ACV62348.1 peptidase A24A prepilin type IV [Desulfofarcimen acetoxidans DSM 771]
MGANLDALSHLAPYVQGGFFVALLLAASVSDIRMKIIPDGVCLGVALTGMLTFEPVKLAGILAAALFLITALLFGGMDGGDIKLMAASGLVLGFSKSMAATVIGLTALLVFHGGNHIIQKLRGRTAGKAYPLAPFLSLGCIAAYFIF